MARKKMSAEEIAENLKGLEGWKTSGEKLTKRFEFENFARSLEFVNRVGRIAERRDHHPDICFGWGYAEFFITTHDAGGLTHNDFELAGEIDAL
ncbi:MAG: 4a-hydroxytetrahydrobiopterin dehydratase [Pyrinomonadaceae bacterium]